MNKPLSDDTPVAPGAQLNVRVRASFMLVGERLSDWAQSRGYRRQNIHDALTGKWDGPKARALRTEIIAYLASKGAAI